MGRKDSDHTDMSGNKLIKKLVGWINLKRIYKGDIVHVLSIIWSWLYEEIVTLPVRITR